MRDPEPSPAADAARELLARRQGTRFKIRRTFVPCGPPGYLNAAGASEDEWARFEEEEGPDAVEKAKRYAETGEGGDTADLTAGGWVEVTPAGGGVEKAYQGIDLDQV